MPRAPLASLLVALAVAAAAHADEVADMAPRDGWSVSPSDKSFDTLVAATREAIAEGGLAVVTQAGPTGAARARGVEIPGNTVIGAFANTFAVDILRLSTPAMIEAPLRFYVTEAADGGATLSYKLPSTVFAPYVAEAPGLAPIASELDRIFAEIAAAALD